MRQMKDSGYIQFGLIPTNWEVRSVKNKYNLVTGFTPDTKNEEFYDDYDGETWINISDIGTSKYISESKRKLSKKGINSTKGILIPKGSLLYSFKLSVGQVAFAEKDLYTNEAIASFLDSEDICLDYFYYMASYAIIFNANDNIYGAKLLNQDLINNAKILFPPLEEQQKIADYLDNKVALIDNIIEKTKESIEEYKKLKQAIITEIVTKGLNPDVKMKDSGIEWIGDIPEHWEIVPIKLIFRFSKGLTITKDDLIDNGIPVVSYGQIHSKENVGYSINDSLIRYINESLVNGSENSKVSNGDFIFADTSEDLEGSGNFVLNDGNELIYAGYHTVVAKLNSCNYVAAKYFSYLFLSDPWRAQIRSLVSGIKLFSITQKILKTPRIFILPEHEMIEIIDKLDSNLKEFENIICKKNKLIADLEIYKKSLIYEVVTGKKDAN